MTESFSIDGSHNNKEPFRLFSMAVLISSDMVFRALSVSGVRENLVWKCFNFIFASLLYFIACRLWICNRMNRD